MSRQINYYMDKKAELDFVKYVTECDWIFINFSANIC